jgi:hypothetical protein
VDCGGDCDVSAMQVVCGCKAEAARLVAELLMIGENRLI